MEMCLAEVSLGQDRERRLPFEERARLYGGEMSIGEGDSSYAGPEIHQVPGFRPASGGKMREEQRIDVHPIPARWLPQPDLARKQGVPDGPGRSAPWIG